jgi:hypothetical protein
MKLNIKNAYTMGSNIVKCVMPILSVVMTVNGARLSKNTERYIKLPNGAKIDKFNMIR